MKKTHTLFIALLLAALPAGAPAAERLSVMLDWFVNPDHGPLIIAREKGFFAAHGLEVTMDAPADPSNPPKLVAAGKVDVAVSYQPQLHIHVDRGLPLSRVATLVGTPLNCVVVLEDSSVRSIADLRGARVGFSVGAIHQELLQVMLQKHGFGVDEVTLVNVNFSLSPSLVSGNVDAVIGAFRNFELNQMDIAGHPGRAFYLEEEGVPAYDELIFVAHRDRMPRDRIRRFVAALEQAVQYIVNHPDEAWELFRASATELDNELNRRAWYDTLPRFALRPAALDHGRYRRFARFLKEREVITKVTPLAEYAEELEP